MKICIITSTRADFGILKNLIFILKKEKKFKIKVLASGTHFVKKFGYTINEIKKNKIKINEKIINNIQPDDEIGISKIISNCVIKSCKIFKKIKPDLLIILGDRYEVFASAIAAHISGIPIAHIHGGEVTSGVIDDGFRHSITKFSHLHFVANKIYKKRIIQLGENPKNIFVVGGLGIDTISKTNFLKKEILEKKFKFDFSKKNFIVNFHPETINKKNNKKYMSEILSALNKFKDSYFIFTMPGADIGNSLIIKKIKKYIKKNKNVYFFKSLGQKNYISLLRHIDGMIGNSSSGILEMPYFNKGTVNLGDRQKGRLMSKSIINSKIEKNSIIKAINKLQSKNFRKKIKKNNFPYGKQGASVKIANILKKIPLTGLVSKKFYDII